jgi:hypothetical protein
VPTPIDASSLKFTELLRFLSLFIGIVDGGLEERNAELLRTASSFHYAFKTGFAKTTPEEYTELVSLSDKLAGGHLKGRSPRQAG